MTIFSSWQKKKRTRNHPFAHVDAHISRKMMRNVIARPFLATNSLGDVSLEKSSIATMNLLAQKIWSCNFFFTFVIMQVAVMESRLRVTP